MAFFDSVLDSGGGGAKRYGFAINKADGNPATRYLYLYDAEGMTPAHVNLTTGVFDYGDWANVWFVSDNKPCMLKSNGTVDYYLNPNDYTKKIDGTDSDVANLDYDGNAMAQIPLVWIKQWQENGFECFSCCQTQYDSTYHAYAHTRADESVMSHIYMSCFDGVISDSKMRSIKGMTMTNNINAQAEINGALANGDLWYTHTWSQRNLINMLLVLISKSDDTQTSFGYGNYLGGSGVGSLLTTGRMSDKGQFYGVNTTGNGVKVFHIENYWGNCWTRVAGLVYKYGEINTKMHPPYNLTGTGYTNTGIRMAGTNGGYVSATNMSYQGRLPVNTGGSQSTYVCDGVWFNNDGASVATLGGSLFSGFSCGAFATTLDGAAESVGWDVGAALSCEPLA